MGDRGLICTSGIGGGLGKRGELDGETGSVAVVVMVTYVSGTAELPTEKALVPLGCYWNRLGL